MKTRLQVSGLNENLSNKDLTVLYIDTQILFEDIGAMKRCGIKWDKLGKSTGMADVEYEHPEDAAKAIREYHGERLG